MEDGKWPVPPPNQDPATLTLWLSLPPSLPAPPFPPQLEPQPHQEKQQQQQITPAENILKNLHQPAVGIGHARQIIIRG
jgi:hypothetical protein